MSFHTDGLIAEACITAEVQRLVVTRGWASAEFFSGHMRGLVTYLNP